MKLELVFVDSKAHTRRGFVRGTFAFVLLTTLILIYSLLTLNVYRAHMVIGETNNVKFILGMLFAILLFACALGVAHPKSSKIAIVYGFLVGFVIFGITNAVLWAAGLSDLSINLLDTTTGCLLGAFVSWALFRVLRKSDIRTK
jgi:uncharacterized membrane protein YccC